MGPRNVRGCAELGVRDACGRSHWGLRWSSLWGTKRVKGVPTWVCVTHAGCAAGTFGGTPYGAKKHVRGVPKWVRWAHVAAAIWAFGGAPYVATKHVRGVPKWLGDACEPCRKSLQWSSRWGNEACEGCAEIVLGDACVPCHRSLRWESRWGHEACEGRAAMGRGTHANRAAGAFGGAPSGTTKRGAATWAGGRMQTLPQEPSVELLMGPRNV